MALFRGNDTKVSSQAITDAAGAALTTGTVNVLILSEDTLDQDTAPTAAQIYVASAAMAHDAAGVWEKTYEAAEIDAIPAGIIRANVRIEVGSPIDATFNRIEVVKHRQTAS